MPWLFNHLLPSDFRKGGFCVPLPFIPMEPVMVDSVDTSGAFLFQVKWDGFRLLVVKENQTVQLWTRSGKERSRKYDELTQILSAVPGNFWLDGELVALGDDAKPDFHRLLARDRSKSRPDTPVFLMLFDCLMLNGTNLMKEPVETRSEALADLIPNNGQVHTCDSFDDGAVLFDRMQELGMEGVVAKRRGSPYLAGGKSPLWQKVKCWRYLTVRAATLRIREGRASSVGMVSLNDEARALGSVASGLSSADLIHLQRLALGDSSVPTSAVVPIPATVTLVVRYLEWTPGGQMRSPSVLSIAYPTL
jgi:bifunctional non-homologous end joining protein LigD